MERKSKRSQAKVVIEVFLIVDPTRPRSREIHVITIAVPFKGQEKTMLAGKSSIGDVHTHESVASLMRKKRKQAPASEMDHRGF